MNRAAKQSLDKAAAHVIVGMSSYEKAREEILAAQKADPKLSNREIGEFIGMKVRGKGYGETWVRDVVNNLGAGAEVAWRRGSHATTAEIRSGAIKLAKTDPSVVSEILDAMPKEQREMVEVSIAQRPSFVKTVKANPVVRDELVGDILGTEAEQRERREERDRKLISKHPLFGWSQVADGLGSANLGLNDAISALVKLAINARVSSKDDALQVARLRAEKLGRSIHELEMAWGETPITDKIEELRGDRVN